MNAQDPESGPLSNNDDHLVVLVHGLWGKPGHLSYLESSLKEKYPEDKLHILVTEKNVGSFTYDGIEIGGERVTNEIEEYIQKLAEKGHEVKKLSVVGYSLGGLIARYSIGLLYHNGWFDKIEPVNFTTFASPHLGVRTPLLGYPSHLWNVLGARVLSVSGRQLFAIDQFRDTSRPLLSVLADPGSIFIKALGKFKHRTLYANIVNDRTTVFYTSGISSIDPYANLDDVNLNYLRGYEPIILDPDSPVAHKNDSEHPPSFMKRFFRRAKAFAQAVPYYILLAIFIPIGTTILLVTSAIQSFRSRERIRLHHEGEAGADFGVYRIPLIINDVHRTAENLYENINHTQSQEYMPLGARETANPTRPSVSSSTLSPTEKPSLDKVGTNSDQFGPQESTMQPQQQSQSTLPTLALTADQFAMIDSLDSLGWRKYPVYIHKVRHSHAAIIRRMAQNRLNEGKVVVNHWLSEFEM